MRHLKFLCTCVILLLTSVAVFAQTQITGHVADMKGEAIIGANVTLKGTTNGTITDFDGHFTLNVTYIIHSGFISGYQNRYGDNLKPPTNVYHRMTA